MNQTYSTSEVAAVIGIHPNTVRLYEELQLISKPQRKANGYRVFTELHIIQFKIARLAFQVEVLQNGLRKKSIAIIKACARCEYDTASEFIDEYLEQINSERSNAKHAILIAEQILSGHEQAAHNLCLTRKQTADHLGITIDTLRNWELNGLLTVKRKQNGYRIYTDEDINRLIVIKSLRCANYSLTAILRMLNALSQDSQTDLLQIIDTTSPDEDIVTCCDQLLTSLNHAETNIREIERYLQQLSALE